MDPKKPLQRRAFLLAFTSLALSLGLPFTTTAAREAALSRSLRKFMQRELGSARLIGSSYLSEPGHRGVAMQTLEEFRRLDLYQPAELAAHIQARRRSDFSRGAIFIHDGWVFADIEARICAIVALA